MPIQDTRYVPPTPDQIEELTSAVIALGDHVRHLRHSVDEIEQELGWAIRTKVLNRLPRPEYPCDERFELPPTEGGVTGLEHACDPDDELLETREVRPPAPTSRVSQTKLW